MAALEDFLAASTRTAFAKTGSNCLLWPADWVLAERGVDLAAGFRHRCATPLAIRRLLRREGGVLALAERACAAAGLALTTAPAAGAIGIVEGLTDQGRQPMGAIFTGRRWAVLAAQGYAAGPFVPLKAWEV